MDLTLAIPDDLGERLGADGTDLARRALEAFAVEECRAGHLTLPELRRLLGFRTRIALDAFLKARGVYESCALEDIEQEMRDLQRLELMPPPTDHELSSVRGRLRRAEQSPKSIRAMRRAIEAGRMR